MPSKVHLAKAAWQWVDSIEDSSLVQEAHVKRSYHCDIDPCPLGKCRRNCKGNPFCLNGLGEKAWFKDLEENSSSAYDPESERRQPGHFVGLKNLGATCYVNTFLQLWFHNTHIRQALYRWQSNDDNDDSPDDDVDWKPSSICGHLQLLFGLLQYSERAYIDPTPLIQSIGLNTAEQQDAQEFSKLFLSVVEGALLQGSGDNPGYNVIQQQFVGTYCYITRCQACGSESLRESTFHELDINIRGHSTLGAALQDFLQEERLEGENQYMCSVCNRKRNAVRFIQLQTLPPVLNLQLLRFVFDVKKSQKKKLSSCILFGDVLDMSSYLRQPPMTTVYDLTSVLIHRGPSAYSGHYVAHIQDPATKTWFRFNDEEISKMKGRNLELGKEEEIMPESDGSKATGPKIPKGSHSSRDAYMLVYTRRQTNDQDTGQDLKATEHVQLPRRVQGFIDRDNVNFENYVQDIVMTQDVEAFNKKEKQKEIQSMFTALLCQSCQEEDIEWLPVAWISSWLSGPDKAKAVRLSPHLCPHGKLDLDAVEKTKIVRTKGAESLFQLYGGDLRLQGTGVLCRECVRQRCSQLHFRRKLNDHSLFLTAALKQPLPQQGQCYWVGKSSLRSWKQLALQQFDSVEGGATNGDACTSAKGLALRKGAVTKDAALLAMDHAGDRDCSASASNPAAKQAVVKSDTPRSRSGTKPGPSTENEDPAGVEGEFKNAENELKCVHVSLCASENMNRASDKLVCSKDDSRTENFEGCLSPDNGSRRGCVLDRSRRAKDSSERETIAVNTGKCSAAETARNAVHSSSEDDVETIQLNGDSLDTAVESKGNSATNESNSTVHNADQGNDETNPEDADSGTERLDGATDKLSEEGSSLGEDFNSDLLCEAHGELSPDENCRRLVSEAVWQRLYSLFPKCPQFTRDDDVCSQCLLILAKEQEVKEQHRLAFSLQKEALHDVYLGRNRPRLQTLAGRSVFVVAQNFIDSWRRFLKNRDNADPLSEIHNKTLLCAHDKLLYPVDSDSNLPSEHFALLWEEEWNYLSQHYAVDAAIEVLAFQDEGGRASLITIPGLCEDCIAQRLQDEEEDQFSFSCATIYVRKVLPPSSQGLALDSSAGDKGDPDYVQNNLWTDKDKDKDQPSAAKRPKLDDCAPRKSQRHRKQRGEKEVRVSSSLRLRELKIKLMGLFAIPTFDQNLSIDGRPVTDMESTLGQLRFYPGCIVILKADEPNQESVNVIDSVSARKPEEGFKGTSLMSS